MTSRLSAFEQLGNGYSFRREGYMKNGWLWLTMRLWPLFNTINDEELLEASHALALYDKTMAEVKALMMRKNVTVSMERDAYFVLYRFGVNQLQPSSNRRQWDLLPWTRRALLRHCKLLCFCIDSLG